MTRQFCVLIRRRKPAQTVGFGKRDSARTRQFRILIRRQNRPGQSDSGIRKMGFGPDSRIRKMRFEKTGFGKRRFCVLIRRQNRTDERTDRFCTGEPARTDGLYIISTNFDQRSLVSLSVSGQSVCDSGYQG